jgi:NTE family protein
MNTPSSSALHDHPTSAPDGSRSHQDLAQVDVTQRERAAGGRALILGGAGSVGNAWEIGVVAGLFEAGVDLTMAELTVGTSAGSTAAAQITSGISLSELLASILAGGSHRPTRSAGSQRGRALIGPADDHMERTAAVIGAAESAVDMRRQMGAAALATDLTSHKSVQSEWRAVAAARLPSHDWPRRLLLIPAVDADTGEPVMFDRYSGVDLVDAVAASTSNGFGVPPYRIGGQRYINGGYRRNENADLAVGYARVLVLSPFCGRSRYPRHWGMDLATQVEELRADGSDVKTIFPDGNAESMFDHAMDLSLRPAAARVGYDQGKVLARQLSELWG